MLASVLCYIFILGKPVNDVGIIKADVGDADSLAEMAKQGKIVLNCVGPYRCVNDHHILFKKNNNSIYLYD